MQVNKGKRGMSSSNVEIQQKIKEKRNKQHQQCKKRIWQKNNNIIWTRKKTQTHKQTIETVTKTKKATNKHWNHSGQTSTNHNANTQTKQTTKQARKKHSWEEPTELTQFQRFSTTAPSGYQSHLLVRPFRASHSCPLLLHWQRAPSELFTAPIKRGRGLSFIFGPQMI